MDYQHTMKAVFSNLRAVAGSGPKERLPKEEQTRCCLYAHMRPHHEVVCAERNYWSVDEGGRAECELWARSKNGDELWIEIKHCWCAKGWVNKPGLQFKTWKADISKLSQVSSKSVRYFILVGFFDFDPTNRPLPRHGGVVRMIDQSNSSPAVQIPSQPFLWRKDDGITHIAAWVWGWPIREYVNFVRNWAMEKHCFIEEGSEMDKWLKWASDQADRFDPSTPSPPSVLDQTIDD